MRLKIICLTVFIFVALNSNLATALEDILELHCVAQKQCKQYEHSQINATCNNGTCSCTLNKQSVQCKPMVTRLTNIIGGACPCYQPNAECNSAQDLCYCAENYIPSTDRRRCLHKKQRIYDPCELDSQCQHMNGFAECNQNLQMCVCKSGFVPLGSLCVSIVDAAASCEVDKDCSVYGKHVECLPDELKCICMQGYVKSSNKTECLPTVPYNVTCLENAQCQGISGANSVCLHGLCECLDKYIPHEVQSPFDERIVLCEHIVERGQYCRSHDDCYQHQFPANEQSMYCFMGECYCKSGYYSVDNAVCVKGNNSSKFVINFYVLLINVACVALLKYFH